MRKETLFLTAFFFLQCHRAWAAGNGQPLAEAMALFQKGAYSQSIVAAEKAQVTDRKGRATRALFLATAHSKMQAFDKALRFYRQALELESDAPNIHYDFGQALFATQHLKEAEAQFRLSIREPFKQAASAYYIGYIRQILENRAEALDFYRRIQKLQSDPDQVKQPALFQIAELENEHYSKEENKARRLKLLETIVLPAYKRARDFAEGTPTHDAAAAKIAQIEQEVDAVALRMVNGNPIPKKAYTLRLGQEFGYDSNVITRADEAIIQVSYKDSFFSKTSLTSKYQFNWNQRFSFIPELFATATFHSRRSTPDVYQNDNVFIAPAFRSKWEHWSRGKPATALLDLEYNLMLRDYERQHKLPYYTRSWNLVVGERVTWFDAGSTTVKASIKLTENYNPDRNNYSPALSIQQNVKIFGKYDLQNTLTVDYLHARDDVNDERNYKLRHSATIPDIYAGIDLTPSLYLNLKDTMKQKGSRGNELLVNPSVALNRGMFATLDGSFEYSFSKNYSKSKDLYQYTKHEIKIGGSYGF